MINYHSRKDIHRVWRLMGRAPIQVTETYLRGHGEAD